MAEAVTIAVVWGVAEAFSRWWSRVQDVRVVSWIACWVLRIHLNFLDSCSFELLIWRFYAERITWISIARLSVFFNQARHARSLLILVFCPFLSVCTHCFSKQAFSFLRKDIFELPSSTGLINMKRLKETEAEAASMSNQDNGGQDVVGKNGLLLYWEGGNQMSNQILATIQESFFIFLSLMCKERFRQFWFFRPCDWHSY